ncbi:uncharacterized protein [Onthophagus taurus]|uniref:uncharacterized protein n=1 Tax=Onthophagus taurus TaxID=166361 RepID=UPI0039BE5474
MSNTVEDLVPNVKRAIDDIVTTEFASPPTINISPGSQLGDGYASRTLAVEMKDTEKTINLFIKYLPELKNDMIESLKAAFDVEFRFYQEIYPEMKKIQEEKGLKENIFDNVPKHVKTNVKFDGYTPIILENLRLSGYILRDYQTPIDEEHLVLALKTFAKYHALSYALKDKKPGLFQKLTFDMKDSFAKIFESMLAESFGQAIDMFLNDLDSDLDKNLIHSCGNLRKILIDHACTVDKFVDDYAVICQGDCWSNNMMFLYDDNGKPVNIKLLDWQVQRFNSPILDVSYFFYNVATKDTIKDFNKYFNLYYNTLADFLKRLGSDPKKVFPKAIYLSHWKKYAKFGLTMAFGGFLMLANKDNMPNLLEGDDLKISNPSDDFEGRKDYQQLMKMLVEHFLERDFL